MLAKLDVKEQKIKLCGLLSWVYENEYPAGFDPSFILRMKKVFKSYGYLTDAQERGLDNIISGFEVDDYHFEENDFYLDDNEDENS